MPELPEVETIVRRLARDLPGRRIDRAEVLRANVVRGSARRFVRALEGRTVASVGRRGKFVVTRLSGDRVWVTHLRMSGKYQVVPRPDGRSGKSVAEARMTDTRAELLPPYTRAAFRLDDGTHLLFIDPRTLGEMEVLTADGWVRKEAALGVEPLEPDFTPKELERRLATSRRPVKEFLLDQTKVAGLGNIYAAEGLWRAGISPRRRARNLGPVRARRLHGAIVDVLTEAIGRSGTSLGSTYLDWADGEGAPGEFYERLNVYDREGENCRRCGTPIQRIVQSQRSTYFCPTCQR
ncbi:MAG TPA: bifunctional DNA-formamidopyrimidine glycosylase/DNA-(apurinic or apyrimidinic site) lyase [Gemmatimonadota bacterium]|nr:bifunctional DNA-formamidopyrimidine glycosylase/DNA-(apurinic or apyrimidinic site) lyase [Gemmatimonadota bacterium]